MVRGFLGLEGHDSHPSRPVSRISPQDAGGAGVCAFLDTIAFSEIGAELLAETDDGYNVLVGSLPGKPLLFDSYAKHPQVLNHALDSTAAGRYQIIRGTWFGLVSLLGLADFSPENQDRAAIELIRQRHALPAIQRGDIAQAIVLCNPEWASLPGAGYGQHENSIASLLAYYETALTRYT